MQERGIAKQLLHFFIVVRQRRQQFQVAGGSGNHILIKIRQLDFFVLVFEGVERPHQSPGGIGQNRAGNTRMGVDFGCFHR